MEDLDAIKRETRETLGLPDDTDLSYITDELATRYLSFDAAVERVGYAREDGSILSAEKATAMASDADTESTVTRYGNHPMRLGTCLYYTTNGVGQPCGTGYSVKACNWRTAAQTQLTYCAGRFWSYRFTFTY
jgi:hypothetical protein